MLQYFLGILAFLLLSIGLFFISKSFFSSINKKKYDKKKLILIGWTGVLLLFMGGLIVIYLYSIQPIPERILNEIEESRKYKQEIPDISLQHKSE